MNSIDYILKNFDGFERHQIFQAVKPNSRINVSISMDRITAVVDGEVVVDRETYYAMLVNGMYSTRVEN